MELQRIAEKKKIEEEKKVSFKESEKAKEEEAKKAEQREKMKIIVKELEIEGTEATRLTEKRANEYFGKKDPKEKLAEMQKQSLATRYYPQEALRKSDLLEKFMVEFSNSALNILKSEGKNLRDLFNIFSKEVNGFLNQDEFYEASKMIMNENVEPEFTNSFFNFFVVGYPKKMTFKVFSHIIFTGKKGNSIYIKLKHRFKQSNFSFIYFFSDFL